MSRKVFDFIANLKWKSDAKGIEKFSNRAGQVTKTMAKIAAAGVAAGVGVVALTTRMAKNINVLDKQSKAMGVNVKTVRALGGYFGDIGMDAAAVGESFKTMNRTLGQFRINPDSIRTKRTMEALGVSLEDLQKLKPEQQFSTLLESLRKINDPNLQGALGEKLFGAKGGEMVGLLRDEKRTVDEIIQTFSKADMLGADGLKGAKALTGQMDFLQHIVGGVKDQFFGLLGGALSPIIEKTNEWAQANQAVIQAKLKDVVEGISNSIKWLIDNFTLVKNVALGFVGVMAVGQILSIVPTLMSIAKAAKAVAVFFISNPILLALTAIVAVGVLIYANWDTIKEYGIAAWNKITEVFWGVVSSVKSGVKKIWEWFSGMLDNPFFGALSTVFLPFITIPALIVKHWSKIKTFFKDLYDNYIKPVVDKLSFVGGKIGGALGFSGNDNAASASSGAPTHKATPTIPSPSRYQSGPLNVNNNVTQNFAGTSGSPQQVARETERMLDRLTTGAGRYAGSGAAI